MLRELGNEDWLGLLGLRTEQVPPVPILREMRNLKTRYELFRAPCTEVVEVGSESCHKGSIWTTAALLAEGEEQIEGWHRDGFVAMDIGTATTFAVAEWMGMRRESVLSVFDNPRAGVHIALIEADNAVARQAGDEAAYRVAEHLVQSLAE